MPSPRLAALLALTLVACPGADAPPPPASTPCDDAAIRRVVTGFGDRMKLVSLMAPDSAVRTQLDQSYSELVSPELLAAWLSAPRRAPGRLTSSPWPDRIEIDSIHAGDAGTCIVDGTLVHMTSVEATGGGVAGLDSVRLTVHVAADSAWRISAYDARPVAAPADTTGDSLGGPAAVDVLRRYYAAINTGDYRSAYLLWGDSGRASGQTFESFAAGYADTERVDVGIGAPGRVEGAAGSRFIEIPVTLRATLRSGDLQRFEGSYTLRRSVVDGASPATRRWHIQSARLDRAPPGTPFNAAGEPAIH